VSVKKIRNPFLESENYLCFGCSPKNESGLQMEFYEDGDEVVSHWSPNESFRGYDSFLHGGIQTTLMDEIAAWAVFVKVKTAGVTSRIDARFLKPVYTNRGKIELRARLDELVKNIATIQVRLFDSKKMLCSESVVECFTYPQKIALKRLHYPGYESFFE
jgi:uncharacterized protein (TIGR00369 family)